MRIASYNIWNSNKGVPKRIKQIINELNRINADIIGLQEVDKERLSMILDETDYKYHFDVEQAGLGGELAILSKYPIIMKDNGKYSLIAVVNYNGIHIAIADIHLPYDSTLQREQEIISVESNIQKLEADFRFILGDYNCSENSSVYRFLSSDTTLNGNECNTYWIDLALVAEERNNTNREMTLDLMKNPRWKSGNVCDCSARVDIIFMHECFPRDFPTLNEYIYFGKSIDEETELSPSDHYGVLVDLTFPKINND